MGAPTLTADPRSGIEAGNRRFTEALAKGDAAGIAKLYTAKGQLLPPNSDFVIGTAAIQNYWRGAIEKGVKGAVWRLLKWSLTAIWPTKWAGTRSGLQMPRSQTLASIC